MFKFLVFCSLNKKLYLTQLHKDLKSKSLKKIFLLSFILLNVFGVFLYTFSFILKISKYVLLNFSSIELLYAYKNLQFILNKDMLNFLLFLSSKLEKHNIAIYLDQSLISINNEFFSFSYIKSINFLDLFLILTKLDKIKSSNNEQIINQLDIKNIFWKKLIYCLLEDENMKKILYNIPNLQINDKKLNLKSIFNLFNNFFKDKSNIDIPYSFNDNIKKITSNIKQIIDCFDKILPSYNFSKSEQQALKTMKFYYIIEYLSPIISCVHCENLPNFLLSVIFDNNIEFFQDQNLKLMVKKNLNNTNFQFNKQPFPGLTEFIHKKKITGKFIQTLLSFLNNVDMTYQEKKFQEVINQIHMLNKDKNHLITFIKDYRHKAENLQDIYNTPKQNFFLITAILNKLKIFPESLVNACNYNFYDYFYKLFQDQKDKGYDSFYLPQNIDKNNYGYSLMVLLKIFKKFFKFDMINSYDLVSDPIDTEFTLIHYNIILSLLKNLLNINLDQSFSLDLNKLCKKIISDILKEIKSSDKTEIVNTIINYILTKQENLINFFLILFSRELDTIFQFFHKTYDVISFLSNYITENF